MKVLLLGLLAVIGAIGLVIVSSSTGPALAANGDNLRTIIADRSGTACASTNAEGDHGSVGVGIAFDGVNLLISCYSDNTIVAIDPADGSQVGVHTIAGASSLGALAWDEAHGRLWGCSSSSSVGTIDLTANTFTSAFSSSGCFDGLAYDGIDDTIWSSADVASSIQHYDAAGTPMGDFALTGLIGACGSSGIAVGGTDLFLANNGCSQIYQAPKDLTSSSLFASFPRRLEDLECDPVTFSDQGVGAIWSIDAYDNVLNAWEIQSDLCGLGGQPVESPTPSPTPAPTEAPTASPTVAPTPTAAAATATPATLPESGGSPGNGGAGVWWAPLAALLMALGGGAFVVARREGR